MSSEFRSARAARRRLPALVMSVLVAVSAAVLGVVTPAAATSASIQGVVQTTSGDALAGVDVQLYTVDAWGASFLTQVQTDSSGTYAFSSLETGTYQLQYSTDPVDVGMYGTVWYPGVVNFFEAGQVVIVDEFETLTLETIQLAQAGSLSGVVTDESGQPIEGVTVELNPADFNGASVSASTDTTGAYTLANVPADTYLMRFEPFAQEDRNFVAEYWDDSLSFSDRTPIEVLEGVVLTGFNAELAAGGTIRGTVVRADDPAVAVPNVQVGASGTQFPTFFTNFTDTDGTYAIYGVPADVYQVRFFGGATGLLSQWWEAATSSFDATPLSVSAGTVVSGIDAQLAVGGSISGTVLGVDGQPVEGARVDLEPVDFGGDYQQLFTDPNGEYTAAGLAGDYRVRFSFDSDPTVRAQYYDDVDSFASATIVTVVAPNTVPGIDARLRVASTISGTVTDSSGAPLEGISVTASSAAQSGANGFATTGPDGSYTVGGLAPSNDWVVSFGDTLNSEYVFEYYDDAATYDAAQPVVLTEGADVTGVDAVLSRYGSVTGTVVDGNGAPLESVRVFAWSGIPGDFPAYTTTDADGDYAITNARPGEATVLIGDAFNFFGAGLGGVRAEWWNDELDPALATTVTVIEGDTTSGVDAQVVTTEAPVLHSAPSFTNTTPGDPYPVIAINAPTSGPAIYGYTTGFDAGYFGGDGWVGPVDAPEYDLTDFGFAEGSSGQGMFSAAAVGPDGLGEVARTIVSWGGGPNYTVTPAITLDAATSTSLDFSWSIPSGPGVDEWRYAVYSTEPGVLYAIDFGVIDAADRLAGSASVTGLDPSSSYDIYLFGGNYDYSARTLLGTARLQTTEATTPELVVGVTNGETSQPFDGASVTVIPASGEGDVVFGTTDAEGLASFDLEPDLYRVTVQGPDASTVISEVVVDGSGTAELEVTLLPARSSISGTVLDAEGAPIVCSNDDFTCPTIQAELVSSEPPVFVAAFVDAADGSYTLPSMWEGEWELTVTANDYVPQTSIVVLDRDDNEVDVDFALEPIVFSTVSGRVNDTNGDPIEGIRVDILSADPFMGFAVATTAADGTYTVTVPVGTGYTARVVDDFFVDDVPRSPSYETVFYGGEWNIANADTFDVIEGVETGNIDFALAVGGSVAGQLEIITPSGSVNRTPDSWPGPVLFREFEGEWVEFDNASSFAGSGGLGSFERDGLPAGTYRVAFLPSFPGPRAFAPVYWDGAASVETATSIAVGAGETVTITPTIVYPRPAGAPLPVVEEVLEAPLEGAIAVPDLVEAGEEIAVQVGTEFAGEWVSVWAYSEPTGLGDEWVQVDTDGTVTVPVDETLPPGPHRIAVQLADDELVGWAETQVDVGGPAEVARLAGSDRFATAVQVSREYAPFAEGEGVVYIANGLDYPDALSAAPAAAHRGAPLLLTEQNALPGAVVIELQRLSPELIVIVGGTGVVSSTVEQQLAGLAPQVERHAGQTRYETSREIAERAFGAGGAATAFIATGNGFADALAAAAAAARFDGPVILVDGTAAAIDGGTVALLDELGTTTVKIAGGTGVVSSSIQSTLTAVPFLDTVQRLQGSDRFGTSDAINRDAFPTANTVYLANGFGFADALAGAALAGSRGVPLFIVPDSCVPASVRAYITETSPRDIVLLGGAGVLSSRVAALQGC